MRSINFIVSLVLAFSCSLSCAQPKEAAQVEFGVYWQQFHKAWVEKDFTQMQSLCRLPITVKGVMDGMKPQKITTKNFNEKLTHIMQEPSDELKNGKLVTTSVYEKIKSIENPKDLYSDDTHMRVEDLEFEKINGSWKLTGLYSDSVQ